MKIKITFPDGRVAEYDKGTTSMQIASSISEGLARNVLGAKVNGIVVDASRPIQEDSTVQLLTWNDKEGKSTFWHSSAHLMAEALEALHPGTKFGIGPAIERMDFITTSIQVIKYCLQMIFKKSNKRSLNWRDNPMSTSAPKYQKLMR